MPNQKAGMDIPKNEAAMLVRSTADLCLTAVMMPSGTATMSASRMELRASSTVAGRASRRRSRTPADREME